MTSDKRVQMRLAIVKHLTAKYIRQGQPESTATKMAKDTVSDLRTDLQLSRCYERCQFCDALDKKVEDSKQKLAAKTEAMLDKEEQAHASTGKTHCGYPIVRDEANLTAVQVGGFVVTAEEDELSKPDFKYIVSTRDGRIVHISGSWLTINEALGHGIAKVEQMTNAEAKAIIAGTQAGEDWIAMHESQARTALTSKATNALTPADNLFNGRANVIIAKDELARMTLDGYEGRDALLQVVGILDKAISQLGKATCALPAPVADIDTTLCYLLTLAIEKYHSRNIAGAAMLRIDKKDSNYIYWEANWHEDYSKVLALSEQIDDILGLDYDNDLSSKEIWLQVITHEDLEDVAKTIAESNSLAVAK